MIEIEGRIFTFQITTDIVRDSFGVELCEVVDNKSVFLAALMRNDTKRTKEFISGKIDVPYAAIEKLVNIYNSEIPSEFFR